MSETVACRVLLVDDDQNFRRGTRRQFSLMKTDMSFQIAEAGSGAEAMEALAESEFDCVLMDHLMPGGTGLEWLARILEAHPGQAVIMVTGKGNEEVAVAAMKNGAIDYLVKGSITPERLEHSVVNAIERLRMQRTIDDQQEQLIEAEKHRVMIESLAAACHHIGQPASVLSMWLEMIKRQEQTDETKDMLDQCVEAMDSISDVLNKLRDVSTYRTEPYRPAGEGEPARIDERILKI